MRSSDTQETALHRCVLCLHFTKIRRLSEKIRQMINLLQDCLPLQDKALQTPLHAAATKLITGNKSEYYEECLVQMVAKAEQIPGKTAEILNAKDLHGNTALHYLAQNEIGLVALRAIVNAGGDISVRNKKKLTPLNIAMNNGCTRVIKNLSTAEKNVRHSSRYDSSIYTTDSPPESPVNSESLEISQNEQVHVEHPYSLPKGRSSLETDASALECTEDSSFSTNEEDASDEVPFVVTEEEVLAGSSDEAHTDKPSDVPSGDLDDPSLCVASDSPADVTDDGPSGGKDNAACGATDDAPGVANNSPSSVKESAPPEVNEESFSNTTDKEPTGVPDNAPACVPDNASAEVPAGVTDNAPAGVPDSVPADVPDSASAGVPADVPDNAHAGVPDNTPAGVPHDAPACVTDDASSVNVLSGAGDVPGNVTLIVDTPPAADNDPYEESDTALSDYGDESPSENESELADHYAAFGNNAIGVQTPGIDPYSCIVHIKQEVVSPVSVICSFFLFNAHTVNKWANSKLLLPLFGKSLGTQPFIRK